MSEQSDMEKSARQWLKARNCIAEFLHLLCPNMSQEHLEHNAAAIIARLTCLDPPLLLAEASELKE